EHVADARDRESLTAEKASSGKEITRPSQDPAGFLRSNNLKDELASIDTTIRNANAAVKVLSVTENLFGQVQESIQRASELAVSTSGFGDLQRSASIAEVQGLHDSIIQLLNTRFGDRTLLAGFKSDKPAFSPDGKYLGDGGEIVVEIAQGQSMAVNISGERAVLGKGLTGGVNILEPLTRLLQGLKTGNTELIQSSLELFTKANDQVSLVRSEIGAKTIQAEHAIDTQSNKQVQGADALASIAEIDAIKVFSDLARDQTVLRAAISTTQKLLTENPTDIFYK
ncbi:hypothetical protein K2X33_15460, partial [bacterium]|nr:hypothetical protein [bacterium]